MGDSVHIFVSFLFFMLIFPWTHVESTEDGYISVEIWNKGLDFMKDLLIEKAETKLVPLELPTIHKTVKIPLIGRVQMEVSNITLYRVHVTYSTIKTGDKGILIDVAGATANLTMNWRYSYGTWLIPIAISDKGEARVQIEGMEIGLTLSLKNEEGSLKLSLLDCGCYVRDLSINLVGGASWLYQGLIDAFEDKIESAVENAVSKKLKDVIKELDPLLESLPKEVSVNNIAAINVTFVGDPELSNSSLELEVNGLFSIKNETEGSKLQHETEGKELDPLLESLPKEVSVNNIAAINVTFVGDPELSNSSLELEVNGLFSIKNETEGSKLQHENVRVPFSCKYPTKMVGIAMHENVLASASMVYFKANKMHGIVNKLPDQNLLNTAEWKFIVPQLYKEYPNDDMNLNISVYSPPIIKIGERQFDATIPLDVIINVLDAGEVIPVACISVVISAAAYPEISGNALAGSVKLNEFTMSQEWSKIGNFRMYLVQPLISTLLRTVVLPYINLKLSKGFPLPHFHGYGLQNTQLLWNKSKMMICSDVASINLTCSQLYNN